MATWKRIITDELLECKIRKKLAEINNLLLDYKDVDNLGLLSGSCGNILFLNYYYLLSKNDNLNFKIDDSIIKVYNNLNKVYGNNFSVGLSGINWSLNHLIKQNFIDIPHSIFSETKDGILKNLNVLCAKNELDYLSGASGIVLSLLEYENATKAWFDEWVNKLYHFGDVSGDTIKWEVIIDHQTKKAGFCLGLAHGVPSIILILIRYLKKFDNKLAKDILDKSINYLLDCKNENTEVSIFPTNIIKQHKIHPSRLAWCYGDLGCALALYKAGIFLKRNDLKKESLSTMKHSAKRRGLKENGVVDADFCHGSIGIAHIFSRFYNYTGVTDFKIAACYWYGLTLELDTFESGLAGYKHYRGPEKGYENQYGLLEGLTGIGLSLISSISKIEPKWDRCLLLS